MGRLLHLRHPKTGIYMLQKLIYWSYLLHLSPLMEAYKNLTGLNNRLQGHQELLEADSNQ